MSARLLFLLASLVAIAGCQKMGEEESAQGLANMEAGVQQPAVEVRLRADGVEITGAQGTYLAFDSPRDTVEIELAGVLGPIVDRSRNEECGAGTVNSTKFPGGLTVNFQQGRMKGWYISSEAGSSGPRDISTIEGIVIGTSNDALFRSGTITQMEESSLGEEFTTASGISGILTGPGEPKSVEAIYSGTTCFFR